MRDASNGGGLCAWSACRRGVAACDEASESKSERKSTARVLFSVGMRACVGANRREPPKRRVRVCVRLRFVRWPNYSELTGLLGSPTPSSQMEPSTAETP